NTWVHVAMVFDGTLTGDANRLKLYVNGVQQTSLVSSGTGIVPTTTSNHTNPLYIGSRGGTQDFFRGTIDDARVWNVARTQAEISANLNTELTGNEVGLVAYYKFNQGTAEGTNTGITTANDGTGCSANGTLTNFALTGTTSNWVAGQVSLTNVANITARGTANMRGNSTNIANNDLTPTATDHTAFVTTTLGSSNTRIYTIQNTNGTNSLLVSQASLTGVDASQFAISGLPALPFSIPASGSQTFTVTFSPTSGGTKNATVNVLSNDCVNGSYAFAIQGAVTVPPNNALAFDGVNDYVKLPDNMFANTLSNGTMTVETWVNVTANTNLGTFIKNWGVASGAFHFGIDSGLKPSIVITQSDNVEKYISSNFTLVTGTWYHVAVVADGAFLRIYINGTEQNSIAYNGTLKTTYPYTSIGAKLNEFGTAPDGTDSPLNGSLDEMRIWNIARTPAQLLATMSTELAGNETGLINYYKFNQGTAGGTNTGLTTLPDMACDKDGTLNGFALTGATSNWITGNTIIAVSNLLKPEINVQGNSANILDNTTTVSTANHTDFGGVLVGNNLVRTYTIQNTGVGALSITNVVLSGAQASEFV
ncbi:MAG: choice-of-anchor D domain-containing protein, partial [Bacteroidetes bacterium]